MIIKRTWYRKNRKSYCTKNKYKGYFLLGIIPLFISKETIVR